MSPGRRPAPALLLVATGGLLGVAAALVQEATLPWGALFPQQRLLLCATYAAIGGAISLLVGRLAGRRRGAALAAAALSTGAAFALFVSWNRPGLPHVYLLVTDTTRADHLSLYGYERDTTPYLRHFAAEHGFVFTNAVSQGSHTIVSTSSLLASVYPSEHGMRNYSDVLSEKFTLLPEYLSKQGYRTYGYVTNPHLGPKNGFDQGFDRYEHAAIWRGTSADIVNRRLLRWLDRNPGGPYFGFLFYIDPHSPYTPAPPYDRMFDPTWRGKPVQRWGKDWGKPEPGSPRLRNMVAQYDGAIAFWDAELEKLVDALRVRDVFDDALVVYTSDHGEEFFEHGNWGHNRTLFEESVRVPLVVSLPVPLRFPRLPRATGTIDGVVSSVDIVPTVLDYLGLSPDARARGSSALPLLRGDEDPATRIAYLEEILERYGPYDVRGIRSRDQKYVRILDYEGDRRQRDLFFDLEEDPDEKRGLLSSRDGDERVTAHLEELERFMAEMDRADKPGTAEAEIDDAALEQLKVLGYVEEGP